jgi:hypothetical protein
MHMKTATVADLPGLKAELRQVERMDPTKRWDWFNANPARRRVQSVFYAINATAGEFRNYLEEIPGWALQFVRSKITNSITKVRAIDVRIRREAKQKRSDR